jgi:hypothetical protein
MYDPVVEPKRPQVKQDRDNIYYRHSRAKNRNSAKDVKNNVQDNKDKRVLRSVNPKWLEKWENHPSDVFALDAWLSAMSPEERAAYEEWLDMITAPIEEQLKKNEPWLCT